MIGAPRLALPDQQAAARHRMPDQYRPSLAVTLINLGNRFSEPGRPADALPPTEEAVATVRRSRFALPPHGMKSPHSSQSIVHVLVLA
jgi:hypothetical protein